MRSHAIVSDEGVPARARSRGRAVWGLLWDRLRRDKAALTSLAVVAFISAMAVAGPFMSGLHPSAQILSLRAVPPSTQAVFGRDALGRDIFARILNGARYTLGGGAMATALAMSVGVPLGLAAGYYGAWLDTGITRLAEVLLAFPYFLLAILVVAMLGSGLWTAAAAVGVTKMPYYLRVVRGSTLGIRHLDYVGAGRSLGASSWRLMWRHILPNVLAPILILATVGLGTDVLAIAGLSFLGLGAQPPTPEWGLMVSEGRSFLFDAPHIMVFPGLCLLFLVLAFNLLGDGLRDALDPRLGG